ncbi:MAG: hypothetical protein ACYTEE_09670 [Planctomycetota bacterium]
MKPLCKDCRYWNHRGQIQGTVLGECRRYTKKVIILKDNKFFSLWPTTTASDWCGEFMAKGLLEEHHVVEPDIEQIIRDIEQSVEVANPTQG